MYKSWKFYVDVTSEWCHVLIYFNTSGAIYTRSCAEFSKPVINELFAFTKKYSPLVEVEKARWMCVKAIETNHWAGEYVIFKTWALLYV